MTTATKTARMTLTLPEELHRGIKARAKQEGKTMRHYVLERLAFDESDTDEEYDLEDVNVAIARGLNEIDQARKSGQRLPHIDTLIPRRR